MADDVFDLALDTIFSDPNLQVIVDYVSPDGVVTEDVQMLKFVSPNDSLLDQFTARMLQTFFEVREVVLAPQKGGIIITEEGERWIIKSATIKDESDRIWLLDVTLET